MSSKKRLNKIIPTITKVLIVYNRDHGTTTMDKHVISKHYVVLNM